MNTLRGPLRAAKPASRVICLCTSKDGGPSVSLDTLSCQSLRSHLVWHCTSTHSSSLGVRKGARDRRAYHSQDQADHGDFTRCNVSGPRCVVCASARA